MNSLRFYLNNTSLPFSFIWTSETGSSDLPSTDFLSKCSQAGDRSLELNLGSRTGVSETPVLPPWARTWSILGAEPRLELRPHTQAVGMQRAFQSPWRLLAPGFLLKWHSSRHIHVQCFPGSHVTARVPIIAGPHVAGASPGTSFLPCGLARDLRDVCVTTLGSKQSEGCFLMRCLPGLSQRCS